MVIAGGIEPAGLGTAGVVCCFYMESGPPTEELRASGQIEKRPHTNYDQWYVA